jgi:hypothetical protein
MSRPSALIAAKCSGPSLESVAVICANLVSMVEAVAGASSERENLTSHTSPSARTERNRTPVRSAVRRPFARSAGVGPWISSRSA